MKNIFLKILLMVFLTTSCQNKTRQTETTLSAEFDRDLLIKKSLEGDSIAFSELSGWLMVKDESHEYFYIASIVANKYNFPDAYFLIFWAYIHPDSKPISKREQLELLDRKSRAYCLYNFLKARELGDSDAKYMAKEFFPDINSIPSANSYLDTLKNIK